MTMIPSPHSSHSHIRPFLLILSLFLLWAAIAFSLITYIHPHDFISFQIDSHTFEITHPRFFDLTLAFPLLLIASFFSLSDFPLPQRILSLFLRSLILLAIVGALIQVVTTRFESHVSTVFLVDTSASIPDEVISQATSIIQDARSSMAPDDSLHVISFADKPTLVDFDPHNPNSSLSITRPPSPETLQSNPAAALRLAYGVVGQHPIKRIVLISDGNETKGSLLQEVIRAKSFNLSLSQIHIPFTPKPEFLIQSLQFPDSVTIGEPFHIIARIFSNRDVERATISLTKAGFADGSQTIPLSKGINEVSFTSTIHDPGVTLFRASLSSNSPDTFSDNNSFTSSIRVAGKPRVLYLEGRTASKHYLERALKNQPFELESRGPHGIPNTISEINRFDLVIISDIPATAFSSTQLNLLDTYTRELGGGLIVVGGDNSFGPGGFKNTTLEKILPVSFDPEHKQNTPSLALLLVVDTSGSMEGDRIEMAKDAAKASLEVLKKSDKIGVVAFDATPATVVPIQAAINRSRISANISRLKANGGTNIAGALAYAFEQLILTPARLKHIILLSDGNSPPLNLFSEVMPAMRFENITVSSVAIGSESDTTQLRRIADSGNGRYYYTNDPYNIPRIFSQETSKVARTSFVDEPFRPIISKPSQIFKGISWNTSPFLLGYVKTKLKPDAEALLVSEYNEPILARSRNGLGKVIAFTSDLKNRWAVNWVRWNGYPKFWSQLIRDSMRSDNQNLLNMTTSISHGIATLNVDAIDNNDHFINNLESNTTITTPSNKSISLPLHQVAPGLYQASLPLDEFGSYSLKTEHLLNGKTSAVSLASITNPYPEETMAAEPDTQFLQHLVDLSGGITNPTPQQLFAKDAPPIKSRQHTWPWFLLTAILLLSLDLLFRRIRLYGNTFIPWTDVLN